MKVLLWILIADKIQLQLYGHSSTRCDFSAIDILLLGELNIPVLLLFLIIKTLSLS